MGRITVTTLELVAAAYLLRAAAGVLLGGPAFDPLLQSGILIGAGLILASSGRLGTGRDGARTGRRDAADRPAHLDRARSHSQAMAERLGRNLATERKIAGISQEELAFRASVHGTLISLIERGMRNPRVDTLVRLAGALGVPPAALCKGISWEPGLTGDLRVFDED